MTFPIVLPRMTRPRREVPALPRRAAAKLRRLIAPRAPARLFGVELTIAFLVEVLARAGYVARGFLYMSMGAIALLAAADLRHAAADGLHAILEVARGPVGFLWLWAVALALCGFAVWRAAQVVLDADRQGARLKGLFSRAGQGISGLVYAALAISVFEVLDVAGSLPAPNAAREQAEAILAWPGGEWVLIGIGLFIVGCGVGNLVQSVVSDFGRRLGCPEHTRAWADWVGRAGYCARGIAFLPLGLFFVEAGLDLDPADARDFGQALQSLHDQPFGAWVMGLTAIGLMGFGLFALIEARYRPIRIGR